jgi:hypothetical protein
LAQIPVLTGKEPGIFLLFPISAALVAKIVRQINPLQDDSRSLLNGNSVAAKRELNSPNRELPGKTSSATLAHPKRTRKMLITSSIEIREDADRADAILPRNSAFYEAGRAAQAPRFALLTRLRIHSSGIHRTPSSIIRKSAGDNRPDMRVRRRLSTSRN